MREGNIRPATGRGDARHQPGRAAAHDQQVRIALTPFAHRRQNLMKPVAPNLVKRNFSAEAPNRLWTGDITYIWTVEGWLYLAVILDVFSRRIVGWSMDRRMTDNRCWLEICR